MDIRRLSLVAAPLVFCLFPSEALADAPPMPPCPAGYTQVGAMECRAPFNCPNGWTLTHGPKCIPWTCGQGEGCGHPRNQCVEATLCINEKGTPSRYCDEARPCDAGETCKAQSVCSGGASKAAFANWSPAGTGAPSSAPPSGAAPSGLPEPAPKHGGCGSCSSTNAKAPSLSDGALAFLLGMLVIRPRARRALRSSPSRH